MILLDFILGGELEVRCSSWVIGVVICPIIGGIGTSTQALCLVRAIVVAVGCLLGKFQSHKEGKSIVEHQKTYVRNTISSIVWVVVALTDKAEIKSAINNEFGIQEAMLYLSAFQWK